jgi:hypothetical protein
MGEKEGMDARVCLCEWVDEFPVTSAWTQERREFM